MYSEEKGDLYQGVGGEMLKSWKSIEILSGIWRPSLRGDQNWGITDGTIVPRSLVRLCTIVTSIRFNPPFLSDLPENEVLA